MGKKRPLNKLLLPFELLNIGARHKMGFCCSIVNILKKDIQCQRNIKCLMVLIDILFFPSSKSFPAHHVQEEIECRGEEIKDVGNI
jgi:hypothetical protein